MALSNMRQWDQYEHPMPEHLEQERVLNAIDQLFEDSNLFPATKEKFPDLIERSTGAVRESVQQALDENRDLRIDKPTEAHPDEPMAQRILEKSDQEKRAEAFGHGVRGWLRKLFNKPRKEAEFMLPEKEDVVPDRGMRAFTQREVLGATYFLDPERAERIIQERMEMEAKAAKATPPLSDDQKYITNMMDLLGKRLGVNVWNERQAYPGIRFAMAFIANLILNPPKDFDTKKGVEDFVNEALEEKKGDDYKKAVEAAEKAGKEYSLMKSKIDEVNTYADELKTLAIKLRELCPEGYTKRMEDLNREIDPLKEEIKNLKKDVSELKSTLRMASSKIIIPGSPQMPNIEAIKTDIALKEDELRSREAELKPKEDELKEIKKAKTSIVGKRDLLGELIESLDKCNSKKALFDFITGRGEGDMPMDTDENIDKTTRKLATHQLSNLLNPYSAELIAGLKANFETEKKKSEEALKTAEASHREQLTPDELVYKLFHHYFTHRKKEGGFLDDKIPDHWIAEQNVSFHNNLRDRALLATRFAISEAKDQAVFAQLYANRGLAQHTLAQEGYLGRFMEWGRSSWIGNKIATTFGRPEQASFNKILERIRTVETTKDGQPHYPFANLELKWITTRGDLRKAIDTKKLDENELPRLASYLEMILKESDKIEIRPKDAEMFYRTIRNLKLVRQEIVHKKFMDEVKKTPGSMPEKLRDLWQKKWAEEEAFDAQMTEEARKRNFIAFLEKEKFDATKKQIVAGIISDLRSDTIKVDEATKRLHDTGYKVGRLSGLGLWSGAQMQGLGEVTKKGIKATPVVIFKTLGFIGRKSVVPLKWLWGGIKQVGGDFKSTFEATAGIK